MNRYFDSYGSDPRRIQYAGSETKTPFNTSQPSVSFGEFCFKR